MWDVPLEYTTIHFNVLSKTRPGKASSTFHTLPANAQLYNTVMLVASRKLGRKCTVPGTCGVQIHYAIRSPSAASCVCMYFTALIGCENDIIANVRTLTWRVPDELPYEPREVHPDGVVLLALLLQKEARALHVVYEHRTQEVVVLINGSSSATNTSRRRLRRNLFNP